jgi:hypothetical protein
MGSLARRQTIYMNNNNKKNVPCSRFHIRILSLRSFVQIICPSPRLFRNSRNNLNLLGEKLTSLITPKLEVHLLSVVRGCLFCIFATTFHSWRLSLHPQPEDAPCCGRRVPLIRSNIGAETEINEVLPGGLASG